MTRPAVDVARIFVASMAALTIGLAAYIAIAYVRTWLELHAEVRAVSWGPLQLSGFALSHCMFTTYGAFRLIDRLGDPSNWEGPYLLAAFMLSITVLMIAARRERRRIRAVRRASAIGHPMRRAEDRS